MKIQVLIFLFVVNLFLLETITFAQIKISPIDKQHIINNLESLEQFVNVGDTQKIILLISPNNPVLQEEVQKKIIGGITYQLDFSPFYRNIEILSTNEVRVNARFTASGIGWGVSGLSTYFVFERYDDEWLITDTDFHRKLGDDYVFDIFKKILIFITPIFLLSFAFWVWMLIDVIKYQEKDKVIWVLIIILANILGAIIYFFTARKERKKGEKNRC